MKKRKFKLLGMTPCRRASIWVAGHRQGQVTRLSAFSSLLVRLLLPTSYRQEANKETIQLQTQATFHRKDRITQRMATVAQKAEP